MPISEVEAIAAQMYREGVSPDLRVSEDCVYYKINYGGSYPYFRVEIYEDGYILVNQVPWMGY